MKAVALWNLALAIALGAFGAHALRDRVAPNLLEVFKTGHSYHMWVGLALLVVASGVLGLSDKAVRGSCLALLAGTFLFSGSLYLMTVTGLRFFGAITPLGGATWIVTFGVLGVLALREKSLKPPTSNQN